jgi:Holliday junction resolvasome RuvABC endonuclease subunit
MTTLILGCDPGLRNFGWCLVELLDEPVPRPGDLFGEPVRERIVACGTIETEPQKKPKPKKKSDDQLRRIVELATELGSICANHSGEIGAICAEAQSWPHPPTMETTPFLEKDVSRDRFETVKREVVQKLIQGELTPKMLSMKLGELNPPATSLASVEESLGKHASATYGVLGSSTMIAFSWGVLGCLAALLDLPVVQVSPQMMRSRLIGSTGGSKARVHKALVDQYGEGFLDLILRNTKGRREHMLDAFGAVVTCLDEKPIVRLRNSVTLDTGDIDFG